MTSRDRIILGVVVAVAALAGYWMLVLGPKRHDAAALSTKVAEQRNQLATAQADVAASEAAKSTYASNYAAVARLGKAVPTDDDVPSLVYQLEQTARTTGVDFRSVKLMSGSGAQPGPANSALTGGNGSAASGPSTSGSSSSSSSGSGGQASTTPAPATQVATATLPPGAAVGPAGFATMPFTFRFEGSFFHLADFFRRLERYVIAKRHALAVSGRLLTVNGISLGAGNQGFPHMTASVSVTAYLLPAAEGLFAGAGQSGPAAGAGSGAQAPGASPTPTATATPPLK